MHRKYGSKFSKYLYKPDMKASVKHDCEDVQHDVLKTESVSIISACTKSNR